MEDKLFLAAYPYQQDVLALPVKNLDVAAEWYTSAFGMIEVERRDDPHPTVILDRDGVRIGFSINGGDASEDGAAVQVTDIQVARAQLESHGVTIGDLQEDKRDGQTFRVFFVIAPDGLCYYFHQKIPA